MKWTKLWLPVLAARGTAALPQLLTEGTTGYTSDSTLAGHTIYAPKTIPAGLKMPVFVWGEGGCIADGLSFLALLTEISSHGVFVLASGAPSGTGSTTSALLRASIDWITTGAGKSKYPNVDSSRIAVAGQSCGGLEAYDMANDTRVSAIGIFNSGEFAAATSSQVVSKITKPIFYFLGGSTDIAYANGERDYSDLPKNLPAWKGNQPTGHLGTYSQSNGGKFGTAAVNFLDWVLRGNTTSATYFTGTGATADGWIAVSQNLDKITVTPI
ncbi:alpha/beta-hydrolase [Stipitochalara longipes BDJ]|nr:alpha/beta-hydrolase [Stipitochalara longipes BDJ]